MSSKNSILLIDPDSKSVRVLEVSLRKAGFNVTAAASAEEGVRAIETAVPDLMIASTRLPDMDGYTLVQRLRQNNEWTRIAVMFLCNQATVEEKVRGLELGVEDFLTRPVYIKEVLTRVRILLQRKQRESFEQGSNKRDLKTKFSGQLTEMAVVDLIQTIEVSRKSGVVHFRHPDGKLSTLYFRDGKVVDAELGRFGGEAAVYRLLLWSEGEFQVEFKQIRRRDVIETSTQAILMEGMRRVDEWGRITDAMPPMSTVLEVDYRILAERLAQIPDEVNGILRLFDGRRTLTQVIDDCDFSDLDAINIIAKLYGEGLLYDPAKSKTNPDAPGLDTWLRDTKPLPAAAPPPAVVSADEKQDAPAGWGESLEEGVEETDTSAAPPPSEGVVLPFPASKTPERAAPAQASQAIDEQMPRAGQSVSKSSAQAAQAELPRVVLSNTMVEDMERSQPLHVARATPVATPAPRHKEQTEERTPVPRDSEDVGDIEPAVPRRTVFIGGAVLFLVTSVAMVVLVARGSRQQQTADKATVAPRAEIKEPLKTEPAKTDEAPKTEAPKTEAPKTEVAKTEAPKTEAPKTEAPKTEAPKTEAPKTELPTEAAKKPEPPVAEAAPGDYAKLVTQARAAYEKGQLKKAMTALEAALAQNPNGDDALLLMANCQLDRGANPRALEFASRAIAANPDNGEAYVVIGAIRQEAGQIADARTAYQTYLRLAPKGRYAGEIRSIVGKMGGAKGQ